MSTRRKSKDPRRVQLRRFRCPECGTEQDMPKWKRQTTTTGHIKTAWCYVCQAIRDFIQVSDAPVWDELYEREEREDDEEGKTPPDDRNGN